MDTTLEDYIASNAELQDAINCVKAQINASKMGKNMLKKVAEVAKDDDKEIVEDDEDIIEQELWKGPSSKEDFLSLRFDQDIDDDEFEKMYENLNRDLKQVDINEEAKQQHVFDLRQVLDNKRFEATDMPSVMSQQWRLREPNVAGKRPAGMPPLVPISLLNNLTSTKIQKRTYNNAHKKNNNKATKIRNFSQRRFKNNQNKEYQLERPKIWDHEASFAGRGHAQQRHPSVAPNVPSVAAFIDAVGGVQFLPLNTVLAAATYLNGNAPTDGTAMGMLTNAGSLSSDSNRAAGCFNANVGSTLDNNVFARSNLHGIRAGNGGRIGHSLLQRAGTQNDLNLQCALKMFLNTCHGNENETATAMNVDIETPSNSNSNQMSLLTAAVENMLKRGIVIKLAEPQV